MYKAKEFHHDNNYEMITGELTTTTTNNKTQTLTVRLLILLDIFMCAVILLDLNKIIKDI